MNSIYVLSLPKSCNFPRAWGLLYFLAPPAPTEGEGKWGKWQSSASTSYTVYKHCSLFKSLCRSLGVGNVMILDNWDSEMGELVTSQVIESRFKSRSAWLQSGCWLSIPCCLQCNDCCAEDAYEMFVGHVTQTFLGTASSCTCTMIFDTCHVHTISWV